MKTALTNFGVQNARRTRQGQTLFLAFRVRWTPRLSKKYAPSAPRELSNTAAVSPQANTSTATASKLIDKGKKTSSSADDGATVPTPAPKGSLSIVFTDIVKSTAIWESNALAMKRAMQIHDSIIRSATTTHKGYEVKQNGDGFMIAFSTAKSALQFCLSVQQELITAAWPPELLDLQPGKVSTDEDDNVLFRGLRLRMSAHWGEPVCNWNSVIKRMDYLGPMVNRAARFIEVTEGGQIVVSREFLQQFQNEKSDSKDAATSNNRPETAQEEEAGAVKVQLRQPGEYEEPGSLVDLEEMQSPKDKEQHRSSDQEFEIRVLGKRHFKGVTEPHKLYFIIPHSLRGRVDHWPKHYHILGSKGNLTPSSG